MVILFVVLADLLWWRWADTRLRRSTHGWPLRLLLAIFISAQIAYALCYQRDPDWVRSTRNIVPLPLHISTYLWHLIVLPVVGLAIAARKVTELVRRLYLARARRGLVKCQRAATGSGGTDSTLERTAVFPRGGNPRSPVQIETATVATLSRRRLLTGAAAVAIPPIVAAGMSGATFIQLGEFRIRHCDLWIPGLPPDLHGLTIAQVTDIHIGKLTRPGMPERIADAANAMDADLIIFSGDLIDFALTDLPAGIDFIRRLKPRHGPECLAMIEGNHDLLEDGPAFELMARTAGLPILIDDARTILVPGRETPVQLLGLCWGQPNVVDDPMRMEDSTIDASMERVMPLRRAGAFPILLSHHPHAFDAAAAAGLPLTLAGHTHGGQIMLTDHVGAGPIRFRYWTGLYRKGASQLFVNNGVGNWFPLRYRAPAEIVQLTLKRVESQRT